MITGALPTTSKIFECVIQGEVKVKDYVAFVERIDGLTSVSTAKEEFAYKEFVYAYDKHSKHYIGGTPHSEVRVRQILKGTTLVSGDPIAQQQQPWELHYVGKWERKNAGIDVPFRNFVSSAASSSLRAFISAMGFRHKFRYMRGGTRWQLPNSIFIESSRMKVLENDDAKEKSTLADLDALKSEAYLIEIRALATAEKMDAASEKLHRFSIDLEPYFIKRPVDSKQISISTATLAAESRKKRQRS